MTVNLACTDLDDPGPSIGCRSGGQAARGSRDKARVVAIPVLTRCRSKWDSFRALVGSMKAVAGPHTRTTEHFCPTGSRVGHSQGHHSGPVVSKPAGIGILTPYRPFVSHAWSRLNPTAKLGPSKEKRGHALC